MTEAITKTGRDRATSSGQGVATRPQRCAPVVPRPASWPRSESPVNRRPRRSRWSLLLGTAKKEADVAGYAEGARRHGQRLGRAGRAGTRAELRPPRDRRTLRRHTGRIRDALMRRSPFLPTPALLPGRKVRLASSPHFSAFPQPYGLKQKRSVPPALPAAAGSTRKSNVLVNLWPRCLAPPRQAGAPSGTALLAESGQGLQVFTPVRTPQAALLI